MLRSTSCKASKPSAVHLKGSGATSLVNSRTYRQFNCMCLQSYQDTEVKALHDCSRTCSYQPGKGKLPDEQVCGPLVSADLTQCNCARPISVVLAYKPVRLCLMMSVACDSGYVADLAHVGERCPCAWQVMLFSSCLVSCWALPSFASRSSSASTIPHQMRYFTRGSSSRLRL